MRVRIHFSGNIPSSEMHFGIETAWAEALEKLEKSLASLGEKERSLIAAIYIFRDGSTEPIVVVRESSPR
jgi:hypothetical protein